MQSKWNLLIVATLGWSTLAGATDLTIHLSGSQPITRKTVQYQCDGQAAATGLPASAFPVEYINGGGNSLVIVPVKGASLIFTNVSSASGARYAAGQYIWWDAAGSVNFYSDSLAGKSQSACHQVDAK
jgi:membrane-bound inhibitor of C-type lysozyme